MRRDRRGCRSPSREGVMSAIACKDVRVTCGSRGRTAQGPSNATGSHSVKSPAGVTLGSCKPLIRRVRSAGVKATVHRCDSLLVCANAHQAAGSHNAQALRTPFRAS